MAIEEDVKFTNEHEWIEIDGKTATIGISNFAQESLGDIVYVELPEVGSIISEGEIMGTLESVKSVSDIYCPIQGEVIEVNKELEEHPGLVNTSPYEDGWIVKIKIDPSDIPTGLMDLESYKDFIQED